MRVFVAGATGALGLPLVAGLAERGHEVIGLTRTPAKRPLVEAAGGTAVVADVFDALALQREMRDARPTHVVHMLTALPKAGPTKASHLAVTNRLRIEGTRNLLRAAIDAGVRRIALESFINVYGIGDRGDVPLDEDAPPLPPHRSRAVQESIDATRSLEQQALEAAAAGRIEAAILRYGGFYGPQTESTRVRFAAVRKRRSPVIRNDTGLLPFIHLDDAVAATIAALERGPSRGVYNIVDDEAVSISDLTREMANVIGAPPPRAVPKWLVGLLMPFLSEMAALRLPLSNRRAKDTFGWRLAFPTYREGLRDTARRLS